MYRRARLVGDHVLAALVPVRGCGLGWSPARRRRRIFYAALKYAVRERQLSANPLDGADDPEWKAPEVSDAVDRRRVASPAQMEKLIAAVGTVGRTQGPRLKALFGCIYYGMLRPSEAASLLLDECTLPEGMLEFSEISSAAGRDWTDDGEVHEASKPKRRPAQCDPARPHPARAGHDDPRAV